MKWRQMLVAGFVLFGVCGAGIAGGLDSPAGPTEAGSAMYRMEDVYNRLDSGATGAPQVFAEPGQGPTVGTMHTLNEIMDKAPATNANAAAAGEVLSGKVFWGLKSGEWGQQAGTVPAGANLNGADGSLVITITDGLYSGSKTATATDTDLAAGNIKAGANIFGVAGKTEVVDTTSGDAVEGDIATGKKAWVAGVEVTGTASISAHPAPVAKSGAGELPSYTTIAGEDGDASMRKGVAWPNPRFTDNSNGTVTDNLTGLIWLKNANAFGTRTWANALTDCATLNSGEQGLTDGSAEGDWRLPNVQELQSLIDYGRVAPALCNTAGTGQWTSGDPFTGVMSSYYWSATTCQDFTFLAWPVSLYGGVVYGLNKATGYYVWPVRGGE